ncbi:MAG: M28 family peptidase [Candidatus Aminicenantales bacterium]
MDRIKDIPIWIPLLLVILLSWACKGSPPPLSIHEIESHIRFLSDDLLEGRGVGSRGLAVAALYQENYFRGLKLEPAFGESYRQIFELKGATPDPEARLEIFSDRLTITPRFREEFVIQSFREDCPEGVEGELIYAGYLIQAPERNWDDIKGADLKGKVLLVEINEPGNRPGGIFDGEDMTYYGRWIYKFEKAAELGATGVLIIHNTRGAAYGWEVLQNSWSRERFFLPGRKPSLYFQGWIHEKTAEAILGGAGLERSYLAARAEQKDFAPVPLGLEARVRQKPVFRAVKTENIAGIVRGKKRKDGDRYILLSAHYDHLGKDERKAGDQIYNGAVDNCSASATLLALARYYSQKPLRSGVHLVFAAVSAEEEGLLGSDYLARHLPFPSSSVLANLNLEMTNVWGETKDVYAIGGKHSDLDEICRQAAKKLGLKYIPEQSGPLGFFFRSDQLSFARNGIPAVWLHEGVVSQGKDREHIQKKTEEYQKFKYHKVSDEMESDWDLRGTVQIARWAQEIIALLARQETLPQFRETSSFHR